MERKKITIECPLAAKSPSIVWGMIGDALGLQKWMADFVDENSDGSLTFKWGQPWAIQEERVSTLVKMERNVFRRMHWVDDNEEDEYWELRIEKSELTGDLTLVITDFADADDEDNICQIWDDCLEKLHSVSGLCETRSHRVSS